MRTVLVVVFFLLFCAVLSGANEECLKRDYGNGGHVCVCNSDHCDTVSEPESLEQGQYLIYTSNKAGLRFKKDSGEFESSGSSDNAIRIDPEQVFQKILGFGGSFTDSTGKNIQSLDERVQKKLMESYFSKDGNQYNLCRVPIGGTDFSDRPYSYDDGDEDPELKNFELAPEDFKYKIPYISQAMNLREGGLRLFGSTWTVPKWIKTNGEYVGGYVRKSMYQTWANYFVKFLEEYDKKGIPFWGVTTQNEPSVLMLSKQINSAGWTSMEMSIWIRENLGPALRNSKYSDIKLMILDDQKLWLTWYINAVLSNNKTLDYVDGIAFHWYMGMVAPPSLMVQTHKNYPDLFMLSTEACNGFEADSPATSLGSWRRGEFYSTDIMEDLLNWVGGWVDWNMVLDETGGPTYISNFVDSAIIVNASANEFYKQPMFYHLGHFSKFIPPDSVHIAAESDFDGDVLVLACKRPDGTIVVVILNKRDSEVPVSIVDGERGTAQIDISERSINTIMYR